MMSSSIRRKALSLCSYAAANNGITQSLERAQPALLGSASRGYVAGIPMLEAFGKSKFVPGSHQGVPVFSNPQEPAEMEKTVNASGKRTHNGPGYFTASGAVVGSALSTPIVNAPPAAKMGVGATLSPTFLPNLALFWHINNGIEEILADYVHHEMTRSLILVLMRLFRIVAAKDVFVATN